MVTVEEIEPPIVSTPSDNCTYAASNGHAPHSDPFPPSQSIRPSDPAGAHAPFSRAEPMTAQQAKGCGFKGSGGGPDAEEGGLNIGEDEAVCEGRTQKRAVNKIALRDTHCLAPPRFLIEVGLGAQPAGSEGAAPPVRAPRPPCACAGPSSPAAPAARLRPGPGPPPPASPPASCGLSPSAPSWRAA